MEETMGFMLLIVVGAVYFLPWMIAAGRNHHNRGAICALNVLLGWTLLGWAGAFVWALTEVHERQKGAVIAQS